MANPQIEKDTHLNFEELNPGDSHYKAYVGPPLRYDLVGAMQFNLLTSFGLRDYHKLLDIGCGSLRSGKMLIPYLRKNNYYGVEPNDWLIKEGISNELGNDILDIKSPQFNSSSEFEFQHFETKFDFAIAQSIFSHTSRKQISTCLMEVKKVLKPEGILLATFVRGIKDYDGSDWVYPDCVTYKHRTILKMIQEEKLAGLKINWAHPSKQTWYAIFHPENKKNVRLIMNKLFTQQKAKFSLIDYLSQFDLLKNPLTKKIASLLRPKR